MTWITPRVVALSPSAQGQAGLVIAASRAGGLGALNFGTGCAWKSITEAAWKVAEFLGDRAFGIRLAAEGWQTWELHRLPPSLRVVVVVAVGNVSESAEALAAIRTSGRLSVAEVT